MTDRGIPKPNAVFGRNQERVSLAHIQPAAAPVSAVGEHERREQNAEMDADPKTFRFTRGVVKFVHPEKGFGFCIVDNSETGSNEEVFFHTDGYTPYTLSHRAEPVHPLTPTHDPRPSSPPLRKGDTIALGFVDYPQTDRPSRDGKRRGPRTYDWTTVARAEELEGLLQERAKKYPVGLYFYPRHNTFSHAVTNIRKPETDMHSSVGYGWDYNRVPALIFSVNKAGEFPHGRSDQEYDTSFSVTNLVDWLERRVPVPEVREGAQSLLAELSEGMKWHEDRYCELAAIIQGITAGDMHYSVEGDRFTLSVGDNVVSGQVKVTQFVMSADLSVDLIDVEEKTGSGRSGQLESITRRWLKYAIGEIRKRQGIGAGFTDETLPTHYRIDEMILRDAEQALESEGKRIIWLRQIMESCKRADTSKRYGLMRYTSENHLADEDGVAEVVSNYQATVNALRSEIVVLTSYSKVVNGIEVCEDLTVGDVRIPVRDGSISANKAWYSPGDSDDGMYTLAAIASGENSSSGSARLGGIGKGEFCERIDPGNRFAAEVIYDALVDYFVANPGIISSSQSAVRQACETALHEAISMREVTVHETEERIATIKELVESGARFETIYDLEVAFNTRWKERSRRRMGQLVGRDR